MSIPIRRTAARVLFAAGVAVAALAALPGIAQATTLPPNVLNPLPGPGAVTIATRHTYWSVMAIRPYPGQDYDLTVTTPSGTVGSFAGINHTDFLAINSNYQPLGNFTIGINHYSGPTNTTSTFDEEFIDTAKIFSPTMFGATTGSPGNSGDRVDYDPAISRGQNVAAVYDVNLTAGQYYVIKSIYNFVDDGNVFLLSSDPANSSTWVKSRASALQVKTGSTVGVSSGGCTRFRAARTDWYGLVILFDDRASGYHPWEAYDIELATPSDGTFCTQAGSF